MNKTCVYCDGTLTEFNGYIVCDKCKVVLFSNNISDDEKRCLIKDFLTTVRSNLSEKEEFLHVIEQKYIFGETLTKYEETVRNNLMEFNDVFTELDVALKSNDTVNNNHIKGLLYRLLMISEWLSKNFGRNV